VRIDVHFSDLTEDQANNLFASLRCDYNGPAPIVERFADLKINPPIVERPNEQEYTDHAMECLRVRDPDVSGWIADEQGKPLRKRGRPAKAKDHGTPSRSEPAEAGPPRVEPAGESAAGTSTPTLDDVRAALAGLMSRKGAEACTAVLKSFDAPRISALFAEQYAAFIKECGK